MCKRRVCVKEPVTMKKRHPPWVEIPSMLRFDSRLSGTTLSHLGFPEISLNFLPEQYLLGTLYKIQKVREREKEDFVFSLFFSTRRIAQLLTCLPHLLFQ